MAQLGSDATHRLNQLEIASWFTPSRASSLVLGMIHLPLLGFGFLHKALCLVEESTTTSLSVPQGCTRETQQLIRRIQYMSRTSDLSSSSRSGPSSKESSSCSSWMATVKGQGLLDPTTNEQTTRNLSNYETSKGNQVDTEARTYCRRWGC